jgi:hypothetical protein
MREIILTVGAFALLRAASSFAKAFTIFRLASRFGAFAFNLTLTFYFAI